MKAPNPKSQAPIKSQAPSTNLIFLHEVDRREVFQAFGLPQDGPSSAESEGQRVFGKIEMQGNGGVLQGTNGGGLEF